MIGRRLRRDICEVLEECGYVWEPDDIPGSIARALDDAWRNGYAIGYDEARGYGRVDPDLG